MKLRIRQELLLALMQVMAKNDIRYYLNGICFMPDGRVAATDGHRMAVGENDLFAGKQKENVIMSVGKLPTRRFNMAVLDTRTGIISLLKDCMEETDDESLKARRVGVAMCSVIDGRYPDIDRVIPKGDPVPIDRISVNAEYLASVGDVGRFMSPKFSSSVVKFYGKDKPFVTEIRSPYGKLIYCIMPMRI